MTVLAFVPEPSAATSVVDWTFALSEEEEYIQVVCLEQDSENATEAAVRDAILAASNRQVEVISLTSIAPVTSVNDRCRKLKPRVLITGHFELESVGGRPQSSEELKRLAPCRVVFPLFADRKPKEVKRILMLVSRGSADATAMRFAEHLRNKLNADVTLGTVEFDSGARAERAGEKAIRTLVHDLGLDEEEYEIKVVVDRIQHRGLLKCYDDHDLIICGTDVTKVVRPLRETLEGSTALLVKRAPPLRLNSLADWLPRINPNDHAELLHDLRQGSRFKIDFISMLALAAAIASLGLMQNSPAVVIGSMLLAPMMTPMIGAGLALAQANVRLSRLCTMTIIYGFLLTLAVSFGVGMITPSRATLSPEVLSRGAPNVLDLLIALFAAIAATIAMARPGIAGAVAGVAIATALVPPICAIGLSLSMWDLSNALGALILFGTNLVAIIVASSFTFTLLGIVTVRSLPRHRRLLGVVRWGLVVLLVILSAPLTFTLYAQLSQGRPQPALFPVTRAVAGALMDRVNQDDHVRITFMGRPSTVNGVLIHVASDRELDPSYGDELRKIVRDKMDDPELLVTVICLDGQWLNDGGDSAQAEQASSPDK